MHVTPNGYAGVLALDDSDTTAQAAFANPQNYAVQNGQLVMSATQEQLLQQVQQKQINDINIGLNTTLSGGFTASNGHTYISTTNGQTNVEGDMKRFELDSTLTSV